MIKPWSAATAIAAALLMVSCSGGGANTPPVSSSFGTLTFKITEPKQSAPNARSAKYLSPATTQLTIDIQQSGVSITGYPQTVPLTTGSSGCTSTLTTTLCQLSMNIAPGSYTASLTAKDASGSALSAATAINATVTAGQANAIPVVMGGIPAALAVNVPSTIAHQITASTLEVVPNAATPLLVTALDADNNVIVGSGAPTYTATISSASTGSGIAIASAPSTAPNAFVLSGTLPGTATLTLTATGTTGATVIDTYALTTAPYVTLLAGSSSSGSANGTGVAASFNFPRGVVYDPTNGDVYVGDVNNNLLRNVTTAGVVTTLAGAPSPYSLTYDSADGNFYAVDYSGCLVIRIPGVSGAVTSIAGMQGVCSDAGGTGVNARFNGPVGIAYDSSDGNLYVAEWAGNQVRKVTAAGVVTNVSSVPGWPGGITYDTSDGNLYVTTETQCQIWKVPPSGASPSAIAGTSCGYADGTGTAASFNQPTAITYDATDGALYVVDKGNSAIRRVTTAGVVTTLAKGGDVAGWGGSINLPLGIAYVSSLNAFFVTGTNTVQEVQY